MAQRITTLKVNALEFKKYAMMKKEYRWEFIYCKGSISEFLVDSFYIRPVPNKQIIQIYMCGPKDGESLTPYKIKSEILIAYLKECDPKSIYTEEVISLSVEEFWFNVCSVEYIETNIKISRFDYKPLYLFLAKSKNIYALWTEKFNFTAKTKLLWTLECYWKAAIAAFNNNALVSITDPREMYLQIKQKINMDFNTSITKVKEIGYTNLEQVFTVLKAFIVDTKRLYVNGNLTIPTTVENAYVTVIKNIIDTFGICDVKIEEIAEIISAKIKDDIFASEEVSSDFGVYIFGRTMFDVNLVLVEKLKTTKGFIKMANILLANVNTSIGEDIHSDVYITAADKYELNLIGALTELEARAFILSTITQDIFINNSVSFIDTANKIEMPKELEEIFIDNKISDINGSFVFTPQSSLIDINFDKQVSKLEDTLYFEFIKSFIFSSEEIIDSISLLSSLDLIKSKKIYSSSSIVYKSVAKISRTIKGKDVTYDSSTLGSLDSEELQYLDYIEIN